MCVTLGIDNITLEEGEELCDICNGVGRFPVGRCWKCQGKGKLDWVEKVVGVKPIVDCEVWGDGRFIYLANGNGGLYTYSVDNFGNLTCIDSDNTLLLEYE